MATIDRVHEDDQVFTYCGRVEGNEPSKLLTGYAVASSAVEAISGMREFGFVITAITSLAEVKQTIQILEMIAHNHPEVEASEFLDVYPRSVTPYPEDSVFCFSGHVVDVNGTLKSGFIVASSVQFVVDYLQGLGFVVESATSLADLRQTMSEMAEIASDQSEEFNSHFVNLKLAA